MNSKYWKKATKIIRTPSLLISIIALLISGFSFYFQFFNIKHSLFYTTLTPELKKDEIVIPLLIKNTGNQTEVLLNAELHLEVKDTSGGFFKRISPMNNKEAYVILSPGDYKTIRIAGNYRDYMFGTIQYINETEFEYSSITVFDNLVLILKLSYLTKYGAVAEEERLIGAVSFDENENVSRIDYMPIELKELDLSNDDYEIMSYSLIPNFKIEGKESIDLTDSNSVMENLDKIQLINRILREQKKK
ncbi:hypothetical protein OKW21_004642 [Catalinimonas alkaloidigena]|uniref:hypothetical protein n=1 Tax=Catalinimonas alkaloidigena TaxID=1075417 RepID=UPI0024065430|nr:hypothetical protein [Catalinimonas alkaloidigena]MDF9799379.1 hypothetical protein [Catalinimonas alkaloidigena]